MTPFLPVANQTLRRAAVLAYSTADSGPWTHCGVTCVREDGLQVPLKLAPLRLITIGQLDQVFNQIDEIIKTQVRFVHFFHYFIWKDQVERKYVAHRNF